MVSRGATPAPIGIRTRAQFTDRANSPLAGCNADKHHPRQGRTITTLGTLRDENSPPIRSHHHIHGVEINPRLVATIQRLPQRTIELILPAPGTVSPRVAFQTPVGPSKTAVERFTSRMDHPSIVVGLVSGTGVRGISMRSVVVNPGAVFSFVFGDRTEVSDRTLSLFSKAAIFAGSRSGCGSQIGRFAYYFSPIGFGRIGD